MSGMGSRSYFSLFISLFWSSSVLCMFLLVGRGVFACLSCGCSLVVLFFRLLCPFRPVPCVLFVVSLWCPFLVFVCFVSSALPPVDPVLTSPLTTAEFWKMDRVQME